MPVIFDQQTGCAVSGVPIVILLVEDNPEDAALTIETLKTGRIRNHITHVEDGVEAMDFLRRDGPYRDAPRPDLILLDLQLPRKSGREVLMESEGRPRFEANSGGDYDHLRSRAGHLRVVQPARQLLFDQAGRARRVYQRRPQDRGLLADGRQAAGSVSGHNLGGARQREQKLAAGRWLRLGPDLAPVMFDDLAAVGQTEAGARNLAAVQAFADAEDAVQVL